MSIDFKKPTTKLVLAFIVGLVLMLSYCDVRSETIMSVAIETQFVGGNKVKGSTLRFTENFLDKYELSLILQTDIGGEPNIGLRAQRFVGGRFQMGVGASYWKNQTIAWNSNFTFSLSLRYNFNDRTFVELAHDSTSGASTENSGLDMLFVGYRFGK